MAKNKRSNGPGSHLTAEQRDSWAYYTFVEFLSQHEACRLAGIHRSTARGMFRRIMFEKAHHVRRTAA